MPIGSVVNVALVKVAEVLSPSFDLRHPEHGRHPGLGILQTSNQASCLIRAWCVWRQSKAPTGLIIPVHAPSEVADRQVDGREALLGVVLRNEVSKANFTNLPGEGSFISTSKNANNLLLNCARTLMCSTGNAPPACTCDGDQVEAWVVRMSMVLARNKQTLHDDWRSPSGVALEPRALRLQTPADRVPVSLERILECLDKSSSDQ